MSSKKRARAVEKALLMQRAGVVLTRADWLKMSARERAAWIFARENGAKLTRVPVETGAASATSTKHVIETNEDAMAFLHAAGHPASPRGL